MSLAETYDLAAILEFLWVSPGIADYADWLEPLFEQLFSLCADFLRQLDGSFRLGRSNQVPSLQRGLIFELFLQVAYLALQRHYLAV